MAQRIRERRPARQPLFVVLLLIAAAAMWVPALHAFANRDWPTGQAFLNSGLLLAFATIVLLLALRGRVPSESALAQLATLVGAFTVLPLILAVPFWLAVESSTLAAAWWEMISSFTTTGASLWAPEELPSGAHLWRALVGWLGGLLIWVSAMAILAPLSLGGFEVRASFAGERLATRYAQVSYTAGPYERLDRYVASLAPVYAGLTLVLALLLILSGSTPFVAVCHALAVMSTSGISPVGGLGAGGSTLLAEFFILLFFALALSRRVYSAALPGETLPRLMADREFALGLFIVGASALVLFFRHWVGSPAAAEIGLAARAFWGDFFTVASFLTTTGFESRYWDSATAWSGLETPGLVLLGLAIFGGGIGTTAGGVKLLRVYALYKHGLREIERLIHPSSVGGSGQEARRIRRGGAMIAWIFFMLFALSIAASLLLLSLTGLSFEEATVLTLAALSNCGPLATTAATVPIAYSEVPDAALVVLSAAMVIGRLELLAIIALMNPGFWRS